jgi:hypothetical protein
MADLTAAIGKTLEQAWLSLVQKLDFPITADVTRRAWRDGSQSVAPPEVVVQAQRCVSEFGLQGPLYACDVSLIACTYAPDDDDQADLLAILGDLQALGIETTPVELTAAMSNLTCHGIQYADETASQDGDFQRLSVDLVCHVQASLAEPTTTTTTTTT